MDCPLSKSEDLVRKCSNIISLRVIILFLSLILSSSEVYSQCSTPPPTAPSALTVAITFTGSAPTTTPSSGTDSGLVGYWKFDERAGTTACDSSGKGNTGTLVNGPLWAVGKVGGALYFDGVDDNITIADSNSLDVSSSFTLSAWVNPASTFTDFRSILVKNYKYYLYASVGGYCGNGAPLAGFDEQTTNTVCQPAPLPPNIWTHLAATYNGSTLTLYRNGVAVGTSTTSKTLSASAGTMQIGANQFGENFKGLIDEVRVHNRALTNAEIQGIFQQESAVRESGLIAHWRFDEGTGTTASDSSGGGNVGTLTNGPQWTDGRIAKGLFFDGIDDNVTVADSNSLDLSSSFTLSAWVNPASSSTDFRSIMVKNYKYFLYSSAAGSCSGNPLAGFNEQTSYTLCQASPLPANTWTHLAATYTGSILTLYRNGVGVGTANIAKTLSATGGTLQIGASQFGENFKGLIDEVRIHNRALTDSEIQATFQQESGGIFSFFLVNSGDKSVVAGSSVTNSISAALDSGSVQAVSFNVAGLPSGAAATFSSASCTPACSTVLTISTTGSTPAGSFPITVTSTGGGVIRSTAFTLSVTLALVGAVSSDPPAAIAPAISENAYFVATDGNDSNPGTQSKPFRTIKKGVSVLKAGGTLLIRGGTYNEAIESRLQAIPSGTSWNNPVTIKAYNNETVTLTGAPMQVVINTTGVTYIIFDGLRIDATNALYGINPGNFARFINMDICCSAVGLKRDGMGMFVSGNNNEFINMEIHDLSLDTAPEASHLGSHGAYVNTGSNNLWDRVNFYNIGQNGIQFTGGVSSGNIVRNSMFRNWGLSAGGSAIDNGSQSSNNRIYNSIFYKGEIGVALNGSGHLIYNNTIYQTGNGLIVNASGMTIKNNLLVSNPKHIVLNFSATSSNNLCSSASTGCDFVGDPLFVVPTPPDFHLQSGSPAISAGTNLITSGTIVNSDGSPPNIGAY